MCDASCASGAVEDEVKNADKAQCHPSGFLEGDRLTQHYGGDYHGVDGGERTHYRAVEWSDERYGHEEGELGEEKSQHRCGKNLQIVFALNLLRWHEP